MWAVLLVPGWVRAWRERSGRPTTIDTFHHQLDVLGRDAPSRSDDSPPGARLRVGDRGEDDSPVRVGVAWLLGFVFNYARLPLDVGIQAGLVVNLFPGTAIDVDGGIRFRYYF